MWGRLLQQQCAESGLPEMMIGRQGISKMELLHNNEG
jgi:hypothetical protein